MRKGSKTRAAALRSTVSALCFMASACHNDSTSTGRELPSLRVDFAGCQRVLAGPICEVSAGTRLTLWSAEPLARDALSVDGQHVERPVTVSAGGYQVDLEIPGSARELRLKDPSGSVFRLSLASHQSAAALQNADQAKNAGDYARARELLASLPPGATGVEGLLARGIAARIALREGQFEQAAMELEQTAAALFQMGDLSDGARDAFALVYVLVHRLHRLPEARQQLERWRGQISAFPQGRALLIDHEAMIAYATGDVASALYRYREAESAYQRLGSLADVARVRDEEIGILGELGLVTEARELHAHVDPPTEAEGACASAGFYTKRAWLSLVEAENGNRSAANEVPARLAESESWERRCGDPEVVLIGLVNRGLWALDTNDAAQVRATVEQADQQPAPPDPYLRAWIAELEARSALLAPRAEQALESWKREELIGTLAGDWDAQLRARVGIAEVERLRGRARAAERSLQLAMAALERAQELAPLGELAHTRFAARQGATRRLVQSCSSRGDTACAYRAALTAYRAPLALQARSTSVRSLSEPQRAQWQSVIAEYQRGRAQLDAQGNEDWRLNGNQLRVAQSQRRAQLEALEMLLDRGSKLLPHAADWRSLPEPAAEDFWLLPFPSEQGWTLFGNFRGVVKAAHFESIAATAEDATHPALVPFSEELRQARKVVILASGEARGWNFEHWRVQGEPLSRRPLAFSSALPMSSSAAPADLPRRPLIIADPGTDLPFAAREGELARGALAAPGARLLLGARATSASLLRLLEDADFFHFAGHARAAGEGAGSALLLANGEVEAWELFGLATVPSRVVLSACEAGQVRGDIGPGWGLAQVLLALGASAVVAPLQRLNDRSSLALQEAFYKEWLQRRNFEEAFWATQALAPNGPSDAASLRLFVR